MVAVVVFPDARLAEAGFDEAKPGREHNNNPAAKTRHFFMEISFSDALMAQIAAIEIVD
jgi:hypothetical protein